MIGIIVLVLAGAPAAAPATPAPAPLTASAEESFAGRDWIARKEDNICGLREPSQVSNPAQVDYAACLKATPEMKEMKRDDVDPNTPKGIQLKTAAVNRVRKACETVRAQNGHCSVWKKIRHKDGRAVASLTDLVKAQF